jgi:nucleotide-binding universal stress UspA family protein
VLSRILVATDGSEASDRMMACLTGLPAVGTRTAILVHVFDVRHVGGLHESIRAAIMPRLEQQRRLLTEAGLDVTIETPLGIPFVEINRIAERSSASLVAVGSLGASLVGEMLLGSTAHAVLHHAERPVLLIRLEITGPDDQGRRCRAVCSSLFGHILFPTDFSDTAERAFLLLEHIAREVAPRISLLHVQDRTRLSPHLSHRLEEFNRIDQDRLDRMRERLERLGASEVYTEMAYGIPAELILERARLPGPTLIVMGSQGRGLFREVLLGSVANHLARLAPLPVLFVPRVR